MNDSMVTIIGSSYFEPIALLFAQLDEHTVPTNSGVQTSPRENGHAVSVCILAVACLESFVMRARYINNPGDPKLDKSVPKFLSSLYSDFPYEVELTELYILRDLLVHNHLWEIEYSWNEEPGLIQRSIDKRTNGDKKYQHHIGQKKQKTNKLGIHVNPVLVGRDDAKTVLCVVWKTLRFLQEKNQNQCGVSHWPVRYKGKGEVLSELMERLCGNT